MSFHIFFVTKSHTFNDEKGEAEILDSSDVRRIAVEVTNEVTNLLNDKVQHNAEELSGRMGLMEKSLADVRRRIDDAEKRLDTLIRQFAALPDDQRLLEAVRNAFHAELAPLLGPAEKNLNEILAENTTLREDYGKLLEAHNKLQDVTARLHGEVNTLQASVNALNNILATIAKVWKEFSF